MLKKYGWIAALFVALAIVFVGCGNGTTGDPDDPNKPGQDAFEYNGPFTYIPFGSNAPTIDANGVTITASSSTGFSINFSDIGYTFNSQDVLEISYEIDVEIPEAVLTFKNPANWSADLPAPSAWGMGRGREYVLGHATRSTYTAESPRIVAATYDVATKTGTFQIRMSLLGNSATAIGFQHNVWADFDGDGVRVAENSKYTVKFTKIRNLVEVSNVTLTAADFTITNLMQAAGEVTAVSIVPSNSAITVGAITIYYNGSTTIPQVEGEYAITFDVAASPGYTALTGLAGGTLKVVAEVASAVEITVGGVAEEIDVTGVSGNVEYLGDGSGYTFERTSAWEAAYAWFKLDLGAKSMAQFEEFTFNYKGIAGDVEYKTAILVVSSTQAGVGGSAANVTAGNIGQRGGIRGEIGTSYPVTIEIDSEKAATFTGEVFVSIFVNANITGGTKIEFSDINFVLGELCEDCDKYPCECPCEDCGEFPCDCACDDCGKEPCECPTTESFKIADASRVEITSSTNVIGFGGVDGEQDWTIFTGSKFLILGFKGSNNNNDGFGGMQLVLQHNNDGWGWQQYETPGWTSFSNDGEETVYFLFPTSSLLGYAASLEATGGKIILNHGVIGTRFVGAWLTDVPVKKGENDVDMAAGFITRNIE